MRMPNFIFMLIFSFVSMIAQAAPVSMSGSHSIDRIRLVTEQIGLVKNRLEQSEKEFTSLQAQHDKMMSRLTALNTNKNLLDKATLDISVTKSNLEGINIELADARQTINWLEKNKQEYENQLNVLNMFGSKIAKDQISNKEQIANDLSYQGKLLDLEKNRADYLKRLQNIMIGILSLENDNYNQLDKLLKSSSVLQVKQQQMQDELIYQQQQNYWLKELDSLYAIMSDLDPTENKQKYAEIERKIFYANENANFAYTQSLIARYKDQIQQMRLAVVNNTSISLLSEIGEQVVAISRQVTKLDDVLKSRSNLLEKRINYLSARRSGDADMREYIQELSSLNAQYMSSKASINQINSSLSDFRVTLDKELQSELSARQGFPTFDTRTLMDLGKEALLLPALTFQIIKNLSGNVYEAFKSTSTMTWFILLFLESMLIMSFITVLKLISLWLNLPSAKKSKFDAKWVTLRWLEQNAVDLFLIANLIGCMMFFSIPYQSYDVLVYLASVWVIFKNIYIGARISLVETTHDTSGHDMKLFQRLRWIICLGGIVTAATVYVHQLPLVYEMRNLLDRLFLFLLMIVSVMLLRSWRVIPDFILSHVEYHNPYFEKSIRFIGVLVPSLILVNSMVGVFGYVNLIMTISRYEGLFMVVLVGYLLLRGLLTDGLEQLSRLMIQYVNNGWLWTEAFLKPLDKVLRVALMLSAGATLFLLYGWDKKSPIVARLTGLLHYDLAIILNTSITPLSIIELFVLISVFYWFAKWTREFVYRLLASRTRDMGMRNSIAIISQYTVVITGLFLCLRVLGIDLRALAVVAGMLAFGIGFGLRDLASNFVCGFLILLERPLRVGDIVCVNGVEGEVTHFGSRAVTVKTWDHMELMVPNSEVFYKSFTNWTANDNTVRTVASITISRHDNPHEVLMIIQKVVSDHDEVLNDPAPEVYLKNMDDSLLEFELRYYINIRQSHSRTRVKSSVLMNIWDAFLSHGIKPPYPHHEVIVHSDIQSPIPARVGVVTD